MDIQSLQFNAADPSGWGERVANGAAPEGDRLVAATREFEAVLLRQYLSEALKPMTEGAGMFGSGSNSIYGYMVTDSLANGMSSSGVFGFSNALQAQLASKATQAHDDSSDTL